MSLKYHTHHYLPHLESFYARPEFSEFHAHFAARIADRANPKRHGDLPKWQGFIDALPKATPSQITLNNDTILIGKREDITQTQAQQLHSALRALSPWRKGPYDLFGTIIDTEWRSDWKWQRVTPHISDLSNRRVLDVGCGTGYHCWRMLGDGADYVLGIDPSMRFAMQYNAVQKYAQDRRFDFLPIGIEDMPESLSPFDTVFSMGVLYHRRNPINHLIELYGLLRNGGEIVLETLIVDHANDGILTPSDRYAQMRNVWSITTVEKTVHLLEKAGFRNPHCVDQNITSLDEQRRTEWMNFHSLNEFLDPHDHSKTIEGYPAPKRGIFIAQKPT